MDITDTKVPKREWNGKEWFVLENKAVVTQRDKQVLERIAQGKSNKIIAMELNIGEQIIKNRASELMRKFDASNRTILEIKAYKMGVVEI